VVVFHALPGGEVVEDQTGFGAGTLLAQIDAPTPLPQTAMPRSTSPAATARARGMHEVRIIVVGMQTMRTEVRDLMTRFAQALNQVFLQ
jgi:hypothetical protein